MALATSAPMLAFTAILSGTGGSLIGAAFKATYTEAPGSLDLPSRFLWLAMADRLGQVIGPLLGAAAATFAAKAFLAAGLFVAVAAAVWLWLPEQQSAPHSGPVWGAMLAQLRNRRLAWLVAILCGYWALQQQMSVLIPLAAARLGARQSVGLLFSLSAVAGLALLLVLPRLRMEQLWQRLLAAQALTAAAMAVPAALPGYSGIVLSTVLLAVAAVLGQPAMDALVGTLAPASARGSAFGFAALSFGVGGALGQVAGGWAWSRWGGAAPWFLFTALGLLTLAGLQLLRKGVAGHDRVA
jgi:DHA1 family multidrug resistance protein-like MFS transporter